MQSPSNGATQRRTNLPSGDKFNRTKILIDEDGMTIHVEPHVYEHARMLYRKGKRFMSARLAQGIATQIILKDQDFNQR